MSLGVGLIGAGTWGATHAKAYAGLPDAQLVAVADLDLDRAQALAAEYGIPGATADYRELLARDDIQAVSVVTPDFAHRELCVAAAEAGKHVLVEKPLATTVADAQAIIEACATAGVKLMVDFHNRWNPLFNVLKQSIDSGKLGEPQMLYLRLSDNIFVPTEMLSWAATSSVAWFLASHTADLLRWLCNSEVKKVYSVSRSNILSQRGIDTPDFFVTTLELECGAVATMENCWILSNESPVLVDFKCEFVGSRGHVTLDPTQHGAICQYSEAGGAERPDVLAMPAIFGRHSGFAVRSIRHFGRCLLEGTEPLVTPTDGLKNTEIVCALLESAETGRAVELS